jgi:hypothetical protein
MAIETIASKTAWGTVRIWDSPDGQWNASAVKERAGGALDSLRFKRPTKDEACGAMLAQMRHIDAQDKRAAKNARDTAELERALLAQRSGLIAGR